MTVPSYQERVASQIDQYVAPENLNTSAPPAAHRYWSQRFVAPAAREIFGTNSIPHFFANAFPKEGRRLLSVGCGDGTIEIAVAKLILERGQTDFTIVGADLSPIVLARFRERAERDGLAQHFELVESDLNRTGPGTDFDTIIANHSLHHILELEAVFDYCRKALKPNGIFAINDMIGRNGHMRWPEAKRFVDAFWPMLPPRLQYHTQWRRQDDAFVDQDCSSRGFEGIRAEDILPLLLERFHAKAFLGFGGLIDVFVDRGYGPNFDPTKPEDARLLDAIATVNDTLLDAGLITPTMMLAYFTKEPCTETCYRGRSARRSVRVAAPDAL